MKICSSQIIRSGNAFALKVDFDEVFDDEWKLAYERALQNCGGFVNLRGSGAPTVDKMRFVEYSAFSGPFPKFAVNEIPEFLAEFTQMIDRANSEHALIEKEKNDEIEREKKEASEKDKELKELNDLIK